MIANEKRKAAEAANPKIQDNSNTSQSQSQLILSYLQEGKSITPIDALNMFGCFRLSARIADLRKLGYKIITETETKKGKNFARYRMEEQK